VNSQFAALDRIKMFDGVGDVNFASLDTSLFECSVEYFAGRTNKRMAFDILSVTGLSPTSITSAPGPPSPITGCVARSQMSQPRHS
jgi:hypothetical protein